MIIINNASYSNVSVTYTADGTQREFSFPFDYLRKAFVKVEVNEEIILVQGTDYTVSDNKTVVLTEAPESGTIVRVFRETSTTRLVSWADASVLRAKDMTIQQVQNLHILEEQQYWVAENAIIRQGKEWNARNFPIKNVGDPVDSKDATNKEYVDNNFMKLDDNGDYWVGRGKTIRDIEEPIRQSDGATKNYVDHVLAGLSITGDRVQTFNSVALMKEAPLEPGMVAMTTGYHNPNDGGASVYTIREKTQSDVEDGGSIIFLDNENVAELISDGTVNVKQFGARGNNLADDTAAIQAALDWAGTGYRYAAVYFPAGYYVISNTLLLPNMITIFGDADNGTVINNQNRYTDIIQAMNKGTAGFIGLTMRHMVWRGGRIGLRINVTGEISSLNFEDVSWGLQSDVNVSINRLLQVSTFRHCSFSGADYGLKVDDWTANLNNFIDCSFTNHAYAHVYFRYNEVNNFIGCRFEAGGVEGRSVIDVTHSKNLNFYGCYFESTHEYIITETQSTNSVTFDGCHFTGASWSGSGGWKPYKFSSDGILQFGNNDWGQVSPIIKGNVFISGINTSLLPGSVGLTSTAGPQLGNTADMTAYFANTKMHKHIVSPWIRTPTTKQKDLVVFKKVAYSGAVGNIKILTGKLTVHYFVILSGGQTRRISRFYHVFVTTSGFNIMSANIAVYSEMAPTDGTITITVQQKSGASNAELVLEALFGGTFQNPETELGSAFQWSFEYIHASVNETDYIEASLVQD